jgi:beta-lactamase superfamily II metal-dependent hydrolase
VTGFGKLAPDRLQVLLLGPGFGESVVVRVPGDPPGWMVVDSLLSNRRGQARCTPLEILDDLSVEPDLVLLTHAHADHAGGMALIVERFRKHASFGALQVGVDSVASTHVRGAAQAVEAAAALRAIAQLPSDRRWDLHGEPRQLGEGTVTVVHPAQMRLDELLKMRSIGPNRISSAVLVEWRGRSVLLGADLERPEWVLLAHADRLCACDPVKVPHHGSAGAFDKTWAGDRASAPGNAQRRMLLTPFDRHPKLPDVDDANGLAGLLCEVDAVHLTSVPFQTSPTATGTLSIRALRGARDAAKATQAPLPPVLGTPTAPQATSSVKDAWLLAELGTNGVCIVRGGAAHVSLTR